MKIKIEGLKELNAQIERLKKGTAKGSLRRGMVKAAEPMAEMMRGLAPNDPETGGYDLQNSIGVSTKLSRSQKKQHKRATRDDKAFVEVFIGAGPLPHALFQEFGTRHHAAQPYARPAFDADAQPLVDRLGKEVAADLEKTIARAAKRGALIK